ncbi:hypothetical protein Q3G72_001457 [Acer saccharum]|nr:hypothetical protein Q3G72_001457 [Acer saccharum]
MCCCVNGIFVGCFLFLWMSDSESANALRLSRKPTENKSDTSVFFLVVWAFPCCVKERLGLAKAQGSFKDGTSNLNATAAPTSRSLAPSPTPTERILFEKRDFCFSKVSDLDMAEVSSEVVEPDLFIYLWIPSVFIHGEKRVSPNA